MAIVAGTAFAIAQFVSSNFISVELTDIMAALVSLVAVVLLLRVWQPEGGDEARLTLTSLAGSELDPQDGGPRSDRSGAPAATRARSRGTAAALTADPLAPGPTDTTRLGAGRLVMAFFPYLLVVGVFSMAKLVVPLRDWLLSTDIAVAWRAWGGLPTRTGRVDSALE